jgi:hypothetical protein
VSRSQNASFKRMPSLIDCLNSCRQALRGERCGSHLHRAPHSLPSTLHVSHLWQAFLVVLFLSQPLGTARLSLAFAPSGYLFISFLLSLLISLSNYASHLYVAFSYRWVGHLQHHEVSRHLSRF